MKFSKLTEGLNIAPQHDFEVEGLAIDSRKVQNNYIFFTVRGGEQFTDSAIKNGAKAVLGEEYLKIIAQRFFSPFPDNMVAVTGTNGKTSVANFTAQLIARCGKKSASIGTLGTLISGDYEKKFSYSGLTSPDIITLFEDLQGLHRRGMDFVCMETSSHGLHQARMGNLKFKSGAFTNFTQDHLDYHKSMDEYFAAKTLLFEKYLEPGGNAVLNADIPEFARLKQKCDERNLKVISYGKNGVEIKVIAVKPHDNGLDIDAEIFGKRENIKTKLLGHFQAENVLASVGLALSLGFEQSKIIAECCNLTPVKGRMDVIPARGGKVVIDYAHTPDALEKAIKSLRIHTSGKLITVFGCGGDRDKGKRPLMGKVASELSDLVIVTDDNPRGEHATDIRKEIIAGCKNAEEVAGRENAIKYAISLLKNGDSILLAGKGHEDYQIIGKEKIPFDEFAIVKRYV